MNGWTWRVTEHAPDAGAGDDRGGHPRAVLRLARALPDRRRRPQHKLRLPRGLCRPRTLFGREYTSARARAPGRVKSTFDD